MPEDLNAGPKANREFKNSISKDPLYLKLKMGLRYFVWVGHKYKSNSINQNQILFKTEPSAP